MRMVFDFLGVFNFLKIFGSIRDVLPFFGLIIKNDLRVSYTHACSAQARLCREHPSGRACAVTLTTDDKLRASLESQHKTGRSHER